MKNELFCGLISRIFIQLIQKAAILFRVDFWFLQIIKQQNFFCIPKNCGHKLFCWSLWLQLLWNWPSSFIPLQTFWFQFRIMLVDLIHSYKTTQTSVLFCFKRSKPSWEIRFRCSFVKLFNVCGSNLPNSFFICNLPSKMRSSRSSEMSVALDISWLVVRGSSITILWTRLTSVLADF